MKDYKYIVIFVMVGLALFAQLMNPVPVHADDETPVPSSHTPAQPSASDKTKHAPGAGAPTERGDPDPSKPNPSSDTPASTGKNPPEIPQPAVGSSDTNTPEATESATAEPTDLVPEVSPAESSTALPTEVASADPAAPTAESAAPAAKHHKKATVTAEPTQAPTEISATPEAPSPTAEVSSDSTGTEPATPVETSMTTPEPVEEAASDPVTSTAEPVQTTTAVATEEPALLDVQQEIPQDTSIVVLDANGQPVPLAAQDAAEIIANSDPVWCPAGQAPTIGANGCSGSYSTLADLVSALGPSISQDGTIWITAGPVADSAAVAINGSTYPTWSNYKLGLQGGWCGLDGVICVVDSSVFSVPISISNWNNDVAIRLVDVQNGNLTLSNINGNVDLGYINSFNGPTPSDGNIVLSRVSGNVSIGYVNAPRISISNSTITNGGSISLSSVGADVYINGVTVDGAAGSALGISTNGTHAVSVTNSRFTNNHADYSRVFPWGDGADIFPSGGNVTITNSEFGGNDWGLWLQDAGNVSIMRSVFNVNNVDLSAWCALNAIALTFPDLIPINLNVNPDCTYSTPVDSRSSQPVTVISRTNTRGLFFTENKPRNLVYQGKSVFFLECRPDQYNFKVNLPNGDKVEIYCPVSGKATITRLDNTTLPAELPTGYAFASAFQVEILQPVVPLTINPATNDYNRAPIPVITEGGHITASFATSRLQAGGNFSVLYWDEVSGKWISLKDFMYGRNFKLIPDDPQDKRIVVSGVLPNTRNIPARVEVSTNFPGIFVLAQH